MKVFAVIDHSGEAARVGLALRETRVVIFGSPNAGTPVMQAHRSLPSTSRSDLVWADGARPRSATQLRGPSRPAMAETALAAKLAGIDALTDAW